MKLEEARRMLALGVGNVNPRSLAERVSLESNTGLDPSKLKKQEGPKFAINVKGDDAIVHFGKYQGEMLSNIAEKDPEYVEWMMKKFNGIDHNTDKFLDLARYMMRKFELGKVTK